MNCCATFLLFNNFQFFFGFNNYSIEESYFFAEDDKRLLVGLNCFGCCSSIISIEVKKIFLSKKRILVVSAATLILLGLMQKVSISWTFKNIGTKFKFCLEQFNTSFFKLLYYKLRAPITYRLSWQETRRKGKKGLKAYDLAWLNECQHVGV